MKDFRFKIVTQDKKTRARVGEIRTAHGVIRTPAFVPVGTQATVKSLTPEELNTLGVQLFFVNTYHAYLRPGLEVIKKFGGLHQFMHWDKPLITDSGGFQVFSLGRGRGAEVGPAGAYRGSPQLSHPSRSEPSSVHPVPFAKAMTVLEKTRRAAPNDFLAKITDDGVEFRSHWDGSRHFFTPEKSIEIQHALAADITIAFDECAPYPTTHAYAHKAMERTHRWAVRSLERHRQLSLRGSRLWRETRQSHVKTRDSCLPAGRASPHQVRGKRLERSRNDKKQALYGVVQGSVYEDLRKESAKFIAALGFDGIAIGGVAVGESKKEMVDVLDWTVPLLPNDKPRHLLGVGEIDDIFELVVRGMDTFDCVQPTRLARAGHVFAANLQIYKSDKSTNKKYEIDITKNKFAQDTKPIDQTCICYACQHFSRAYLHHLFRVRELLAYRLATIHNIHFVNTLMGEIRRAIAADSLLDLAKQRL